MNNLTRKFSKLKTNWQFVKTFISIWWKMSQKQKEQTIRLKFFQSWNFLKKKLRKNKFQIFIKILSKISQSFYMENYSQLEKWTMFPNLCPI